jgi:PAS domain S-box-containing protein
MKQQMPGRKIVLLVWVLVMIGILAGVATNGLVGWTLHGLNKAGQHLAEQEAALSRGAEQLRRLSRQVQTSLSDLLQLDFGPLHESFPAEEFAQLQAELQQTAVISGLERVNSDLGQRSYNLRRLWQQAVAWRDAYQLVYDDNHDKKSLLQVRSQLQALRAELDSLEGGERLQEALKIRRWRTAAGVAAQQLANELLSYSNQTWRRSLDGVNTELVDLSRMVEMLAGEDRFDQLADLKDNQLKPSLERLATELKRLRRVKPPSSGEGPVGSLQGLNDALFGRGHVVYEEYQTIRPGVGGLYQMVQQRLDLLNQRESLQARALSELQQLEALYPPLASLTQQRSQELAEQAERSLNQGALNLFMLSLLTLGGFLGLGFLIINMTRQQLSALSRLRRQNELILTSAGEGVLGLDLHGEATFVNPAAARQLGWSEPELVGQNYREILGHRLTREDQSDPVAAALREGRSFQGDEEIFCRRDGSQLPVACAVAPLQNHEQIEGAVVTFRDISERKAAEKTLRRYYDQLAAQEQALAELNKDLEQKVVERTLLLQEQSRQLIATREELAHAEKLAAVGSLAAGVAHEINNPAAIIRGNVEILQASLPPAGENQEELDEILYQVERISLITGNLLAFARKQNLTVVSFDLNRLLSEILEQIGHQVSIAGIEIRRDLAAELPLCRGDAERLRQVFTNLIVNALQALNGQGRMRVDSAFEAGEFRVRVVDNGPGIPDEIRSQIFHPFFTTKAGGTGLGLSVSYGIIQAHGGDISIESEVGSGSSFCVSLPGAVA